MTKYKLAPCHIGGICWALGGQTSGNHQTDGPIGTTFGTNVRIYLGTNIDFKNNCPSKPHRGIGGGGGVYGVKNSEIGEICQTAGANGTKFGTRLRINLGMDVG